MTQRIDMTGQRFNRWTVVSYGSTQNGRAYWLCECACGVRKEVHALSLRDGRSTSCGCHRIDHRKANLVGQTFSLLTVIKSAGSRPASSGRGHRTYWLCRCVCGIEKTVLGSSLAYGSSKSCGRCAAITHGEASNRHETTEYRSWSSMLSRCQNPKHTSWENYGGRGITVCERWQSYESFLADMGRKPSPSHTIDRKEVDGHYEPSNCRWATKKEQIANRRPFKVGRLASFSEADLIAELNRRLGAI